MISKILLIMTSNIYNNFEKLYRKKKEQANNGWQGKNEDLEIINWSKKLLEKISIQSGKLLELGCGAGNISFALTELGFEVTGVDISLTAIDWAREKFKKFDKVGEFHLSTVTDLRMFKSNTFDIAFDSLCFHNLIGEEREKSLQEVYRVLKNDGYFLMMTMCNDPRNELLKKNFDFNSRYIFFNDVRECYFGTPEMLINELEIGNFSVANYFEIEGNSQSGDQDMFLAICQKKK